MTTKSRIKKIESRVKINHSPFCACERRDGKAYPRVETILEDNGVQTIENPVPDFCERCGKPIEKRQIIISLIERREQVQI